MESRPIMPFSDQALSIVREFENAWLNAASPKLREFAVRIPPREKSLALVELIAIDLERRWKSQFQSTDQSKTIRTIPLEAYLSEFPAIADSNSSVQELAAEEYRARQLWGDKPSHSEYLDRFPELGDQVRFLLREIDRELLLETDFYPPREAILLRSEIEDSIPFPGDVKQYEYEEFVLRKMIGFGGLGKVYRATMKASSQDVAVKFLKKRFYEHPESVASFLNEALTVAKLSHPGIVRVHGIGKTPFGAHFLVMELVEGKNLSELSNANNPRSNRACLQLILQAVETLEYVHQQGVIHCDLKPANILVDKQESVKIADFGFARSKESQGFRIGANAGTLAYMAPEQANSYWGDLSEKTDIYGIGAVLYELLSGTPSRTSDDFTDLLVDVARGKPVEPLSYFRPEISGEVETLCMKCLNSEPKMRFASMSELKKEIASLI